MYKNICSKIQSVQTTQKKADKQIKPDHVRRIDVLDGSFFSVLLEVVGYFAFQKFL